MKHFKILMAFAVLVAVTVFIYSCAKEEVKVEKEITTNLNWEKIKLDLIKNGFNLNPVENSSIRGSSNCPPDTLTSGCFTTHVTDTIPVPANGASPGCATVQVQYDITICGITTTPTVYFTNFQAYPLGCASLWAYWSSLSSGALSIAEEKFFYDASLIAEALLMETIVDNFGAVCPNRSVESVFTNDLCYQKCLISIKQWPYYAFETSHCGLKCCHRTRVFCRNISGFLLYSVPTFHETGDNCSDNPTNLCDGLSTVCAHTCGPK